MNAVKSFTIYEEYYDLITLLDEEEQKDILLAIMKYMFENEDMDFLLNDKELKIFKNLKRPLDKSKNKSKSTIKTKSKRNQNKTKMKTHQDVNVSNYDNNYVVNVDVNVNNKKFKKPTLEEIQEYCQSRNNDVDAEKFFDYYEANEWKDKDGKKVKSWKQKIITWEGRKKEDDLPKWFNNEPQRKEIDYERKKLAEQLTNGTWKP